MNQDDQIFIQTIRAKIKENPSLITPAILAITAGAEDAVKQAREFGADMETLACTAIMMAGEKKTTKKTKEYFEELAKSKLEKYKGKTHCNWDWAKNENKP